MTERSRNNVAVAPRSEWVYDWTDCPRGAKMLLLTDSGIAILGHVGNDTRGYLAWAPLPDRKKASMPNKPVIVPMQSDERDPMSGNERAVIWHLLKRLGGCVELSVHDLREPPGTLEWMDSHQGGLQLRAIP